MGGYKKEQQEKNKGGLEDRWSRWADRNYEDTAIK